MKNVTILPALLLAATTMVATSACENTREGAERDAEVAADQAQQSGDRAADAARDTAREAEPAVRDAGDAVADGAATATDRAATAVEVATTTTQVKSALIADGTVDADDIDVDTNGDRRTVTLRGSVKSAAQKTAAERIARDKAEGFKIVNELTIAG
jgi:osmotically-inducible protein OsmY